MPSPTKPYSPGYFYRRGWSKGQRWSSGGARVRVRFPEAATFFLFLRIRPKNTFFARSQKLLVRFSRGLSQFEPRCDLSSLVVFLRGERHTAWRKKITKALNLNFGLQPREEYWRFDTVGSMSPSTLYPGTPYLGKMVEDCVQTGHFMFVWRVRGGTVSTIVRDRTTLPPSYL